MSSIIDKILSYVTCDSFKGDNDDIELAENVIELYAEGLERLGYGECREIPLPAHQCLSLIPVLGYGEGGVITSAERVDLQENGFSQTFIDHIAGHDGLKALQQRVKWLADELKDISGFWTIHTSEELLFRNKAIDELYYMGPLAEEAVPVLIELLSEDEFPVALRSTNLLVRIGPAALSSLIEALESRGPLARMADAVGHVNSEHGKTILLVSRGLLRRRIIGVLEVLRRMGPQAAPALPQLIRMLDTEEELYGIDVVNTLSTMGPTAVPILFRTLHNPQDNIRAAAIGAIGTMREGVAPTIPVLEKIAAHDPNPAVARWAEDTLNILRKKMR